jgi:adenylosuccinate synthase
MDLLDEKTFTRKVQEVLEEKNLILEQLLGAHPFTFEEIHNEYMGYAEILRKYAADTSLILHQDIRAGKSILFEGAQGTLLDVDHGTYPYVTSSSTCSGGACTGSGVSPREIHEVIGISKAYATRVGSGPFPTELDDVAGDSLRNAGNEFGATTGRPRRCGWFDALVARYAVRVNGLSGIAITKLDVLSGLDTIKVCIGYRFRDTVLHEIPASLEIMEQCTPIYEELPGWSEDLTGAKSLAELPQNARDYVTRIGELAGAEIVLVSIGPRRSETIVLRNPFQR